MHTFYNLSIDLYTYSWKEFVDNICYLLEKQIFLNPLLIPMIIKKAMANNTVYIVQDPHTFLLSFKIKFFALIIFII